MAVDIVATVGANNANSFVTTDEMTAYCEGRLNASLWTEADAQVAALVEATRDLSVLRWNGARVNSVQALSWPRIDCPNPDLEDTRDVGQIVDVLARRFPLVYASDIIPQRVKDATCELALQYLKAGTTDLAVTDVNTGVIRKKVGPLETEWADNGIRPAGVQRFERVWALVTPLLRDGGNGGLTMVRV